MKTLFGTLTRRYSILALAATLIPGSIFAQKIYYVLNIRDRTGTTTRTDMIYSADLDGSNDALFYSFPTDSEGDFSALTIDSANQLLFSCGSKDSMSATNNPNNILRFDIAGGGSPTILREPAFGTFITHIQYDPDTNKIYSLEFDATGRYIRRLNPDGTGFEQVANISSVTDGIREIGIGDLTGTGSQVFFSSVRVTGATTVPNEVYRTGLISPTSATLVRSGFGIDNQINGMALDELNQQVYVFYQDSGTPMVGDPSIQRFNMDGSGVVTTIGVREDTGTNVRDLRVDSAGGKIYWADINGRGSVRRANLDGSNIETIVLGQEEMPAGAGIRIDIERALALDLLVAPSTAPEIAVEDFDGTNIPDGDATPSVAESTDFGDAVLTGGSVPQTFTIRNTGDAALTLSGMPRVVVGGANAADFTVTAQPPVGSVAPAGSTTFTVTFDPTATGTRNATVSIANDDSDENPYNFSITGNGLADPAPEIVLTDSDATNIPDGDATPSVAESTDFGSIAVAGGTVSQTYTITNSGDAVLNITTPISISGTNAGDFSVTSQPSATVAASGGTTMFTVEFDPSTAGARNAEVSIGNNDSDENPFNFAITGNGTTAPEMLVEDSDATEIPDGDMTPSVAESTDFGSADITAGSVTQTYTIINTGDAPLTLSGMPRVEISGSADFSISSQPTSATLPTGGGSTTFEVAFDPSSLGTHNATVSIANNDADENPYDFLLTGVGGDTTPPIVFAPGDGGDISAFNNLGFTWTAPNDPESGIASISIILGSTPGGTDIRTVDVTGRTDIVVNGLPEGDIFAFIRATNGAGLSADSTSTDGIFIDSQQVQITLDGVPIITNDPMPVLTGTFLDPDPSSGMDVIQFRAMDNGLPTTLFNATFDDSETSGPWTGTQQIPLPVEGVYRAQLRGIDNAFNRAFTVINNAIIFDQTRPEITYFGTPGGDRFDFFVNSPFTLRVETSDNLTDVTGFDPNTPDIVNSGGHPATFTLTNAGPNDFEFLVEPIQDEVLYQLQVSGPDAVFDGAGNGNLRGSSPVTFTYDITPPELLCEAAFNTVSGEVQSGDAIFVSVTFNEPAIGVVADAFSVSGPASIVGVSPSPGPDTTFVVELENEGLGDVTVGFNNGFITDRAGNAFDGTGLTTEFEIVPAITNLPDPAPLYAAAPSGTGDRFGDSIDLYDSVAVIGVPGYGSDGAAIVLVADDETTFSERRFLQAANLDAADNFGDSVATSGNWILVGSSGDDDHADSSGAAYFFLAGNSLTSFTEVQKATVQDFAPTVIPERLGRFGQAVAMDGITAAIGQPLGRRGGAVFVYTLDVCDGSTGMWMPSQVVVPDDLNTRDEFGGSIAVSGDRLLVGSRRDDDRGSDTGSVYHFKRVGGVWDQIQKILPGDTVRLDQVGTSVAIDNSQLVFGAPGADEIDPNAGAGYVYRRTVSDFFFISDKLTSLNTTSGDGMGSSIAVSASGERGIIIGSVFSDLAQRDAGAAYLFRPDAGANTFSETNAYIFPDSPARNDRFGHSVAMDGQIAIIGNPFTDENGRDNGGLMFVDITN